MGDVYVEVEAILVHLVGVHVESHFQHAGSLWADVSILRGVKIVITRGDINWRLEPTSCCKRDSEVLGSTGGGGSAHN